MNFVLRLTTLSAIICFFYALWQPINFSTLIDFKSYQGVEVAYPILAISAILIRSFFKKFASSQFFTFWDTLEHEFTHIFFAYLHFKKPGEMKISATGNGHITLTHTNTLICIAPYTFPLWASFFYWGSPIFNPTLEPYIHMLSAILLGNFFFRFSYEFHSKQSDFDEAGKFLSYLFIFSINASWISALFLNWTGIQNWKMSLLNFKNLIWEFL